MPAFLNRVFKRDHYSKKLADQITSDAPGEPKHVDGWSRTLVAPEEIQELLRGCTTEVKTRGLSTPFLLLPFRPNSDPCAARSFIRNFFDPTTPALTGAYLQQELRLTEPDVLCSALKWCWSRLPGGVVTWDVYELFRQGEVDSSMARDSFATFIPISAESEARSNIIFDYFDLLSAIAANGKHNGLGGLKLSRLAGWWAFEHTDLGYGFEGGYSTWTSSADASCHLFFAYLRSLSPADPSKSVSLLPTSLRALLASVDYPPSTPPQFQTRTVRVAVTVDKVSPSPFALLRRAKNLPYDNGDYALKVFTDFDDPIRALTDECRRVLKCISSTGHSTNGAYKTTAGAKEQSWSRFQDIGFSGLEQQSDHDDEVDDDDELRSETFKRRLSSQLHPATTPTSPRDSEYVEIARPTTPSWADFMDAGFGDRELQATPTHHLLPPSVTLPPIETADRLKTSQSQKKLEVLEPGELDSVTPMEVDDVFWWVWMSSLAGEETPARKAVFGRCALVETTVSGVKWLVVEEKVRGAAVLDENPVILKKERKWTLRLRRKSMSVTEPPITQPLKSFNPSLHSASRTNIGPDQTAKIQAAAAALRQQQMDSQCPNSRKRNSRSGAAEGKTNSVFTLQPVIMSEATPAMKWANRYDRDALRDAYLNGKPIPEKKPVPKGMGIERALPAIPSEAFTQKPTETPTPLLIKKERGMPPSDISHRSVSPSPTSPSPGRFSPSSNKTISGPVPFNSAVPEKSKKVSRLRAMFGKKNEGIISPPSPHLDIPLHKTKSAASIKRHSPIELNIPVETPVVASPDEKPPLSAHPALLLPTVGDEKPSRASSHQGSVENQVHPALVRDDSTEVSDLESIAPPDATKDQNGDSQVSPPNSPAPPIHDRWAQIRKNAADRAKVQTKVSDDVSATTTEARGSIDEGETSGEETIESRVARIKARVAQLTAEGSGISRP